MKTLSIKALVERRLEFRQGLLVVYVDLKKAFDSMHRETLWDILHVCGIHARIIDLINGLKVQSSVGLASSTNFL